jgi:hypothetical protein
MTNSGKLTKRLKSGLDYVLITGASMGLGKELAKLYAASGQNLVLVSRNKNELNSLKTNLDNQYTIDVQVIVIDLAKSQAAKELYEIIETKELSISTLVNNAGFGYWGNFLEQSEENIDNMLHLHIHCVTQLTWLFGRQMIQNGSGRIVQIASTSAFQSGPYMATYFATKAYLLYLSEAVRAEVKSSLLQIQIVCPGAFHSSFAKNGDMQQNVFFKYSFVPTVETVSKNIFRAIHANKKLIIPGWYNRLQVFLLRFTPRTWVNGIIASVLKPKS